MANDLLEGARFFIAVDLALHRHTKKALTKAARLVRDEARRVLGTYDYGWPPLKPETIAKKQTGDSPLLETGALRASIHYKVNEATGTAIVGSNDPKALYHELGTSRIPPRSFLQGAAMRKEHEVTQIVGHDLFGWAVKFHGDNVPGEIDYPEED